MAGRGPQTFKKRQKEQQRKEKQQEKLARRTQRKQETNPDGTVIESVEARLDSMIDTEANREEDLLHLDRM
jgi:hypothetical protein